MKLRCVIQVSQDGRNWTVLDVEAPIPIVLLTDYAYVRPVLLWLAEAGDAETLRMPAPPRTGT